MLAEIRRRDHVERLASEGVEVLAGSARFIESDGRPELAVTDVYGVEAHVAADEVIIASGARPFIPDIPGIEDIDYLTYETAMSLEQLPSSLVVIGGNAVGLEQARLFAGLGAAVTVVDSAPRIAPFEDAAVSAALRGALEADGITFHTGVTVTSAKSAASGVEVTLLDGTDLATVAGEKVLIATGRRPATDGLGLEVVGVATGRRGELVVDEHLRTSHPHVRGAGDVTGIAQFVYVAHAQGIAAAANALAGEQRTLDYAALPRVTFTWPAVAAVGLTAAEAAAAGVAFEERELSMSNVPRALLDRMPHGVLKLVSDAETQRLLGIHMVGEGAGDVVGIGARLVAAGMTTTQIAEGWVPSFTMAEALAFAAQLPPAVVG